MVPRSSSGFSSLLINGSPDPVEGIYKGCLKGKVSARSTENTRRGGVQKMLVMRTSGKATEGGRLVPSIPCRGLVVRVFPTLRLDLVIAALPVLASPD